MTTRERIIHYYLNVLNISSIARAGTSSWIMLFVFKTYFFFHSFTILPAKVAKNGFSLQIALGHSNFFYFFVTTSFSHSQKTAI